MEGIRKQDKIVFHEVAVRRNIWILVRETNPYSQKEINRRIGVPMVQHSSEAQFAEHSDEPINAFTPQGQEVVLGDQSAVECYYLRTFKGRQTVKVGAGPMERIPAARDARKA